MIPKTLNLPLKILYIEDELEQVQRERDLWKKLWELKDCDCQERDEIYQQLLEMEG